MTSTTTTRKRRSSAKANPDLAAAPLALDHAEHIAVAAYFKAEARGFSPGRELDDWLEAEQEAVVQPR